MRQTDPGTDIGSMLSWANGYLEERGINDHNIDAELLMTGIVKIKKNELYLNRDIRMSESEVRSYRKFVRIRARRFPVDYILGYSVFMGLKFDITADTLIPRQETELLVEEAMRFVSGRKNPEVVEVGSGCGNIAVALAKFTDCHVVSVEKSTAAARIARKNAVKHSVNNKIEFVNSDMFCSFDKNYIGRFDCLVSNPPYVKTSEYDTIQEEVRKEPKSAFVAGSDGLMFIKIIIKEGRQFLKTDGRMFIEIGYNQKKDVEDIIINTGYGSYYFVKDYNGIDRIAVLSL